MMLVFRAEARRFLCNRVNLLILAVTLLALGASAAWSGLAAGRWHADAAHAQAEWVQRLDSRMRTMAGQEIRESPAAARDAFEFGRSEAPPARRTALGGLALSMRQFTVLPADIRVSVDSRHLDGRRSDAISNPLLDAAGMPDFAVMAALLLPLAVIGLGYGLVQEAREQGTWRLACAQCARPVRILWCGLTLRFAALLVVATAASLPAFWLDPGATAGAFGWWTLALAAYLLLWIALAGLFNLLRISSAACALAMLALWLFVSFATPGMLFSHARSQEPGPSRLSAIIELRSIAQEAEVHMHALLEDWYAHNPEHRPQSVVTHAWPVSFVPRFLEQDSMIVPLMAEFDFVRAQRMAVLEPLAWSAPGLALVLAADRLAGADAAHHSRFVEAVDGLEERWRASLVPRIMSYRGLQEDDLRALPILADKGSQASAEPGVLIAQLAVLAMALLAALALAGGRVNRP